MFRMKKGFGKFFGLLVALSMIIASYNKASAASVVLTDIAGHWAETAIQSAVDNGYILGHGNGLFSPENPLKRAEFASMVNKAFNFSRKASLNFADMKDGSQWFYSEAQIAVGAGYMIGYDDNKFYPLKNMTWAECITVYVRLLGYPENISAARGITNYNSFQGKWYVGAVGAAFEKGILDSNVMINGAINPDTELTRAEAAYMLTKAYALKNGGTLPGAVTVTELADRFEVPANATFGPTSGVQTVTKNVSVTGSGAILQNLDIRGNLTIENSVGDGDVYLRGVTVTGTTTILAGGPNTIRAVDTQFSTVNLNDSNNNARLLIEGNSRATSVNVNSGGTLAAENLTGTGYGTINVSGSTSSAYPLNINANIGTLNISSYGSYVNVTRGVVGNANIASTATSSTLNLASSATVSTLVANASSTVNGKVNQATLNTTGVHMPQAPTTLTSGSQQPSTSTGTATGLNLSPSTLTLNRSNASGVTLTATVSSTAAVSGQSVTFYSSDSNFVTLSSGSSSGQSVTVYPSGNTAYVTARLVASDALIAANMGKTITITANYGGYTQSSYVTIGSGTTNTLIAFSPSTTTFTSSNYTGVSLSATIGSTIASSGQYVTFTSSDPSLVTLSSGSYSGQTVSVYPTGNVAYFTARLTSSDVLNTHNGRSVTITANYGGYTQSMLVYINTASGTTSSLSASPSSVTLSEKNMSGTTLTATANSTTSSTSPMTFTIGDSSIATLTYGTYTGRSVSVTPTNRSATINVKPAGKNASEIIANRGKTTVITITYGSYTQTVPVTISSTPVVVDATITGSNTVSLNGSVTLSVSYLLSDGTKTSSYSGISWSTSNNNIMHSGNGVFKGVSVGVGTAILTIPVPGGATLTREYPISVTGSGFADFTVSSPIVVDRISKATTGQDFNVTLKAGINHIKIDYDSDNYSLYYYDSSKKTMLYEISDNAYFGNQTYLGEAAIETSVYGSTTITLKLVPNNKKITKDNGEPYRTGTMTIRGRHYSLLKTNTNGTKEYDNVGVSYNDRPVSLTFTTTPSISVDTDTIETKDGVIRITITQPTPEGELMLKAYNTDNNSPNFDNISFQTQNALPVHLCPIPVKTTSGTNVYTVSVPFYRDNGSTENYIEVVYVPTNPSIGTDSPNVLTKKVTLKADDSGTGTIESPTLDYIFINDKTVYLNKNGAATVISEPFFTESTGTVQKIKFSTGSSVKIIASDNYVFPSNTEPKDTVEFENVSVGQKTYYIWTVKEEGGTSSGVTPSTCYIVTLSNIINPSVTNVASASSKALLSYNPSTYVATASIEKTNATSTTSPFAEAKLTVAAPASFVGYKIENISSNNSGIVISNSGTITIPAKTLNDAYKEGVTLIEFNVIVTPVPSSYQNFTPSSTTIYFSINLQ